MNFVVAGPSGRRNSRLLFVSCYFLSSLYWGPESTRSQGRVCNYGLVKFKDIIDYCANSCNHWHSLKIIMVLAEFSLFLGKFFWRRTIIFFLFILLDFGKSRSGSLEESCLGIRGNICVISNNLTPLLWFFPLSGCT